MYMRIINNKKYYNIIVLINLREVPRVRYQVCNMNDIVITVRIESNTHALSNVVS